MTNTRVRAIRIDTAKNGIVDEKYSEWVSAKHLSAERPQDPALSATGDYALVGASDSFAQHKDVFAESAKTLIDAGRCTAADFTERISPHRTTFGETKNEDYW